MKKGDRSGDMHSSSLIVAVGIVAVGWGNVGKSQERIRYTYTANDRYPGAAIACQK